MTNMAKIDLPYVQRFKDRHGHWRSYFRKKGSPRIRLPEPGTPGFLRAYDDAVAAVDAEGAGATRTVPGTIDALIVAYYQSGKFMNLGPSTQRAHRNLIENFRAEHGVKRVATIHPRHIDSILAKRASTPAQASNLRKRLRQLFALAVKLKMRRDNPVLSSEKPIYKTDGFTPWSEDDIGAYERQWASGTKERLALALLLYTGQRRSDVVTMGRQHIEDGRMQVKQRKTGTRVWVAIHPELQAELDAAPKGMTLLLTEYGKPFSDAGFTAWIKKKVTRAGLTGRTPHGLRKAAGRRLAEAGCTAHEIMSILGHSTLAEAQRYTNDADKKRLADAGMARIADKFGTSGVKLLGDVSQPDQRSLTGKRVADAGGSP